LFSEKRRVPDPETCEAIGRKLEECGLKVRVSATDSTSTQIGYELKVDLMMAFAGYMEDTTILHYLEKYGLIDQAEVLSLIEHPDFEENSERLLRPIVQRAYRDYYGGDARLNS
jgi:hypothetical protein